MSAKEYDLEDLLNDANTDLEKIEDDLADEMDSDMESALEEASKDLEKSLRKLLKGIKKEVRSDVMNFYHEKRKLVDADLKSLNSLVKEVLSEVRADLTEEIHSTDDKEDRKLLKEMRGEVARFSRKYNHAYHKLRLKLALGNAGVEVKNFFH